MTPDEMIEVLQAFKEGKAIECRARQAGSPCIWEVINAPCWNFVELEYRVKREPRTVWVNVYESHLGSAHFTKAEADSFSGEIVAVEFREVVK